MFPNNTEPQKIVLSHPTSYGLEREEVSGWSKTMLGKMVFPKWYKRQIITSLLVEAYVKDV